MPPAWPAVSPDALLPSATLIEPGGRRCPLRVQIVWLFSMLLGYSRYVFARFVRRQDLHTVVRCHLEAFAELGGVPREVLYDRMKTAVLGEDDDGKVRYHPTLLDVASHFGFRPRACAAYRAKTKGKVERIAA